MGIRSDASKESISKGKKGWKAARDRTSGKTYYYHRESREVRWDKPRGFDEARDEKQVTERVWDAARYENDTAHNWDVGDEDIVRDVENPTLLFHYLQQRSWAAALKHVKERPQEAKVWISSGLLSPQKTTWRVLPLHASIILGAPFQLVFELIDIYPDGVRMKDLNGTLPIHLSAAALSTYSNNSELVFKKLMISYPASRNIGDKNGHTPLKLLHHTKLWQDGKGKERRSKILQILSLDPLEGGKDTPIKRHRGNKTEPARTDPARTDPARSKESAIQGYSTGEGAQLKSLINSWIAEKAFPIETASLLKYFFDKYLPKTLSWTAMNNAKSLVPASDAMKVKMLLTILDGCLNDENISKPEELEHTFVYCVFSAFGPTLGCMESFSEWWRGEFKRDHSTLLSLLTSDSDSTRCGIPDSLEFQVTKGPMNAASDITHSLSGASTKTDSEKNMNNVPDVSSAPSMDSIFSSWYEATSVVQDSADCDDADEIPMDDESIQTVSSSIRSSDSKVKRAKGYFKTKFAIFTLNKSKPNANDPLNGRIVHSKSQDCPSLHRNDAEDGIIRSKSEDCGSLRRKDADEYYDCLMATNSAEDSSSTKSISRLGKKDEKEGNIGECNSGKQTDTPNEEEQKWAAAFDEMTKKTYYYHTETNEVRWDKPQGVGFDKAPKKSEALKESEPLNESGRLKKSDASFSGSPEKKAESWQKESLRGHLSLEDVDSPTVLFLYLHQGDWVSALNRISEHPMEASVWIWRRTRGYLLWRLLPLHASIVLGAPSYLVLEILNAYPNACRMRDMSGDLPVHLAAASIDSHPQGERIVNHLMRAFPDSIGVEDGNGRTAIEIAKLRGKAIDTSDLSLEPEDDFMLGQAQEPKNLSENDKDAAAGAFTLKSGFTFHSSGLESSGLNPHIDDDFERYKSGYLRISYSD